MSNDRPDCHLAFLGEEAGVLTGWSRRVVQALAHIREAWCVADPFNRPAAEAAAAALLGALMARSSNCLEVAERVLRHGLDEELGEQLWSSAHSQATFMRAALDARGVRR